jgi:branched-chain amino acid transport system substrate-binding protein
MSKVPPILYGLLGLGAIGGWQLFGTIFNGSSGGSAQLKSGDRTLFQNLSSPNKQAALTAYGNRDWSKAAEQFGLSLKQQPNDPESAIYQQNALVAQQSATSNIAIVAVVPASSNPNVASEILRGVAAAQIQINQTGGIGGKLLKVYIADDANEAEKAVAIAKEVITQADILAVVGSNASSPSLAAAKIYQAAGLVMISPTSSTLALSGFGNYIFRTVSPASVTARQLANYSVKVAKKTKTVICLDDTSTDNQAFADSYKSEFLSLGGTILPVSCKLGNSDLNASGVMESILHNGADSILIAPHIERLPQATDLIRANHQRLTLFSSPTMYTHVTLEMGGKDVVGMALPVLWHPDLPEAKSFSTAMEKLWQGKVNWRSATAYDATVAIGSGGKNCVSPEKIADARACLATQLRSPSFGLVGAGQAIRFNSKGDREMEALVVKVVNQGSGRTFQLQPSALAAGQ